MILYLNDRKVEVELNHNNDGSQFVQEAYYLDTLTELTNDELDELQETCDSEINANWRG